MITYMDKNLIIQLKLKGYSFRKIALELGIDRKTVAKYYADYEETFSQLKELPQLSLEESDEMIRSALSKPKYNSSGRNATKYTPDIDHTVDLIIQFEEKKNAVLGKSHKQKLTKKAIHQILTEQGFNISYRCLCDHLVSKFDKPKEAFIRQQYEYGDRLEYDFGEIKVLLKGKLTTLHLAVLSSPASGFRWAYVYKNQKKESFLDSHVRFFEMVQGVYKEVVYDNMRNVVSSFIGKQEKQLNEDLLKIANYYGYIINVTNCFSGNEKGHVEKSVKVIRDYAFTKKYEFNSFEEVEKHLEMELIKMNESSTIREEMNHLMMYRPKYELATITAAKVNKYSCIQFETNFYSVPDYLVGTIVELKVFYNKFMIYANHKYVCEYKKEEGHKKYYLKLEHFINTLRKKPGSIRNSAVLKQSPRLYTIFINYFNTKEKEFIELIYQNRNLSIDELIHMFETKSYKNKPVITLEEQTREQLKVLNKIYKVGADYVN